MAHEPVYENEQEERLPLSDTGCLVDVRAAVYVQIETVDRGAHLARFRETRDSVTRAVGLRHYSTSEKEDHHSQQQKPNRLCNFLEIGVLAMV